jgi:hypothetical protein
MTIGTNKMLRVSQYQCFKAILKEYKTTCKGCRR